MKNITGETIEKVAQLASLELTEAEVKLFSEQLSEVIDYNVTQLKKTDTESIEPITNITGLKNALRADETSPGLSQEEALANAPATYNGFFKVKGILD